MNEREQREKIERREGRGWREGKREGPTSDIDWCGECHFSWRQ
jgi:hypothetical protein